MALQLSIVGPHLEVTHVLPAGGVPLVLGRDPGCSICLADPLRNISRRHLGLWNEQGALHFNVLSVANGVELDGVPMPSGMHGVLSPGQVLLLSVYRLEVTELVEPGEAGSIDPWQQFEQEAARLAAEVSKPPQPPDDDPFGTWGFQSTVGPTASASTAALPAPAASTDLAAFWRGLGLPAPASGSFTQAELEAMGRLTRSALEGLLRIAADEAVHLPAPAANRTAPEPGLADPLRMDTPLQSKLWYLFGGTAAAAGCIPPDEAVSRLIDALGKGQDAG